METWVEKTRREHAQLEAERAEARAREADKAETRRLPMKERVARIIRELPPDQRAGPFPLAFFVEQLKPKYSGGRAAPRDVARGLRENGWTRTRCWRRTGPDEEGFRAVWHSPQSAGGKP